MREPVAPNPEELITERARVLRVVDHVAWVHCESQSGCARCAAGEGCGAGLFARLLRGRLQELPVPVPRGFGSLAAGDHVLLGLSAAAVQNASILLYGAPLAALLLGALAGDLAIGGDAGALPGAILGLVTGAWFAHRRAGRLAGDAALQPVILRRLAECEPCPLPREA